METVRVVVEREVAGRHFFVVTFQAEHDTLGRMPMHKLMIAEQDEDGDWHAQGFAGGGGDGTRTPTSWVEPRVNLAGVWAQNGFRGGGYVHSAETQVARVRLSFADGPQFEDDAESGWVFFFTGNQPVGRQVSVELLDRSGQVLASHPWGLIARSA
jgi:hypothetical protein